MLRREIDIKKERLIKMKLIGSLDNYKILNKEPEFKNKTIAEIKQRGNTIKKIIIKHLNLTESEFNEFENENQDIQYVKSRWSKDKEKGFKTITKFYKWYIVQPKTCCYCGVPENLLKNYFSKPNLSKRKRGKRLEIERILTHDDNNVYSESNCSLACYVCNNAKSDLITYKDFKHIALGIHNFWKTKFQDDNFTFPESFYNKNYKS
ncbi:MAG: hypothetical protein WA916_01570 [Arcobacter sp.]|uniref:hypothetical protein n=1 Tax=Arcobacter sp. TaxID=1872629 RepID=UPI003C70BCA7